MVQATAAAIAVPVWISSTTTPAKPHAVAAARPPKINAGPGLTVLPLWISCPINDTPNLSKSTANLGALH
jgi:hypothetical protein